MAEYRIQAKDLAEAMGMSANAVSSLKNSDDMPRLNGEKLNLLCNKLSELSGTQIGLWDLIHYEPDPKKRTRQSKQAR